MDRKKIEVKMIPTKWLAYFDRNINVLSGKKREDLMKSIEEEGIKEPLVVVEKENTKLGTKFIVLDGNHKSLIDSKHGNTDWTKIMEIDGQAKFIKGKIDHRKSLLIKDNRLLNDLQDNPNKEHVRKLIMEGLILSDFSGLLGDLLDNVTEEMVKKLVGVE
jgi:putative sterol carrier protein